MNEVWLGDVCRRRVVVLVDGGVLAVLLAVVRGGPLASLTTRLIGRLV